MIESYGLEKIEKCETMISTINNLVKGTTKEMFDYLNKSNFLNFTFGRLDIVKFYTLMERDICSKKNIG